MSTACSKSSTSKLPSARRNFIRLSEARLQAELSTCMYSLHGFEALIRPDSGQVCQRLIVVSYWMPGSAQRQAASAIWFIRSRAGERLGGRAVGAGGQVPVLAGGDRLHEVVGDPHRVVGVLVLDRGEALTVDRHVEAGVAQRGRLVLLFGLAPDEVLDVRVVDVEDDHLRRAPGLAARLDRARPGVGAAHEADRAGGEAALREVLDRAADVREVDPRAGAAAEDHPLLGVPVEDRLHRVVDAQDEAGGALRLLLEADVEPDRRVEGRLLVQQDRGQLHLEGVGVLLGGEVAALAAPAGDRPGDAADHLFDRALALGAAEPAAEVLLGDDVGRVLGPGLGELDAALLEGGLLRVADHGIADLPLDLVERMHAGRRKATLHGEAPQTVLRTGSGGLGHLKLLLSRRL